MKRLLFLILVFYHLPLQASSKLTKEMLTGQWLIVQISDLKTNDLGLGDDIWKFKNNQFLVLSSGKHIGKPEPFVIKNNTIIYGTHPYTVDINVIKFSDMKMSVEIRGSIQILEKIKK